MRPSLDTPTKLQIKDKTATLCDHRTYYYYDIYDPACAGLVKRAKLHLEISNSSIHSGGFGAISMGS